MSLHVPPIDPEAGILTAALAYAAAGLFVGPVKPGTKHPGSRLGAGWPRLTSTDPHVIASWFAGSSDGVFIHAGRSGLLVLDVDDPSNLHPLVRRAIDELEPPYQTTRAGDTERGHYLFAMPPGRVLGNGVGNLASGWGEIRGRNGVIVVAPTVHADSAAGGLYRWQRPGLVPPLPAYLADQLDDAQTGPEDTATAAEVAAFLDAHTATERPELVGIHVRGWQKKVEAGESRHQYMTGHLAGAMKEARAGLIDARTAADTLESTFLTAVQAPPRSGKQGPPRTLAAARSEWAGILAWAVAVAMTSDPEQTRARVAAKVPADPLALVPVNLDEPRNGSPAPFPNDEPMTLAEAHAVFTKWLGSDYDLDALDVVLAAAAVERLDGDPLWLLLISGSGNAKTETVQALAGAGATMTSTITSEGALLSATSTKERTKEATGGLLREIGARGLLVVKDVTSILSMNRDMRAQVLGALREVYDGSWTRKVGTDGGRSYEWAGRVVVVGAVTTAWDKAHAVIASMGDRFVLVRMDSTTGRQAAGRRAIGNTGSEDTMRAELADAARRVLATMNPTAIDLDDDETDALLAAADLVTLARTGVEYDYRGDVIDAHAPEMPTRFAKQLAQVVRGVVAIGAPRDEAMRLAIRCARDSMPPLRLAIVDDLAAHPDSTTADVRKRLAMPRATVDRQLQALHMLGVLEVFEAEAEHRGKPVTVWTYRLSADIDPEALKTSARKVSTPTHRHIEGANEQPCTPTDISGTALPDDLDERPRCEDCTRRLGRAEADAGVCLGCQRVRIATEIARAGVRR